MRSGRRASLCVWILGAALWAAMGSWSVAAEDELTLSAEVGKNYETLQIHSSAAATIPSTARLTLVATDAEKGVKSLSGLPLDTDEPVFDGRTAARALVVDGYAISQAGADVTTNAAAHRLFLMGKEHDDHWVDETPETFASRSGSGVWRGTSFARVEGDMIRIDTLSTGDESSRVTCSFGEVPGPRRGYTLQAEAFFQAASSTPPEIEGRSLGLTISFVDDDQLDRAHFLYVENGNWKKVPLAVCDPSQSDFWQIYIVVDCLQKTATYYVRASEQEGWKILGTAQNVSAESVTQAEFQGDGGIKNLKGNGFDTQLLNVEVEFDPETLHPGLNLERTVISGTIDSSIAHDTDRLGGTCHIRLIDLSGNVIANFDCELTVGEEIPFSVQVEGLTAGAYYRAEVAFEADAEAIDPISSELADMGRPLTNELWGTDGLWVHETARTFDGRDPGTGAWSIGEQASVAISNEWICVTTAGDDQELVPISSVKFVPMNELSSASYSTHVRFILSEDTNLPREDDGVFGLTVATLKDEGVRFMCLSNRVWQTVPGSLMQPVAGVEYELSVYVMKETSRLHYLIRRGSSNPVQVMVVQLEPDLCREFRAVDISGVGAVADLIGSGYSTELVRMTTDFDASSLTPGTNFAGTAVSGKVQFEKLWETDRTSGQVYIAIYDKDGVEKGRKLVDFQDLADVDFQYYFEGLEPGESYSANVGSDLKGFESDSPSIENTMARVVTNESWTTDGWIREDWKTFAGEKPGTGDWLDPRHFATTTNGMIVIDTTTDDGQIWNLVSFLSTNGLSSHTGLELKSRICFDDVCDDLPKEDWRFGVAIIDVDEKDYRFAVITNGVWAIVPPEKYRPGFDLTEEYEMTIRIDQEKGKGSYLARASRDAASRCLIEYDLAPVSLPDPVQSSYSGTGRVRALEGDGLDVTLVNLYIDFDEGTMTPGTNFEGTAVSGKIRFEQLWLTDRTNGQVCVTIRDKNGNEVGQHVVDFQDLSEKIFQYYAEGLAPGEIYEANVSPNETEGFKSDSSSQEMLMARIVTNDTWATEGWIREDWLTFAGEKPGTGKWLDPGHSAVATNGMIVFDTMTEEGTLGEALSFIATNTLPNHTGFELKYRLFAEIPCVLLPEKSDTCRYGITIVENDENDYRFAVLINGAWTIIDPDVYRPILGADEEYEITIHVDQVKKVGSYLVRSLRRDAASVRLVEYALDPAALDDPTQVEFSGVGRLRKMEGDGYDVTLVNLYIDFDEGSLTPGTNFEGTAVSGRINFEQLWLTDHTTGTVCVIICDKTGHEVGRHEVKFQDFSEQDFRAYIEGLIPGESYSVNAGSDIEGFESDSPSIENTMARVVTNGTWATEGWIREDSETFAGEKLGTGKWLDPGNSAVATNGMIVYDTTTEEGAIGEALSFLATNTLPNHTGVELRYRLFFDKPCTSLPQGAWRFGITTYEDDNNETCFAILTNNTWMIVDPLTYKPVVGNDEEYEVAIRINKKTQTCSYFVRAAHDRASTCLIEYALDPSALETTPVQTDFSGSGRVRTLEGDGYDVTLVNIDIEFDEGTMTPGTNFAGTAVSGKINFEQLWLTDRTTGTVYVTIRDKNGDIVGQREVNFQDFTEKIFQYYIDGLKPGESYSANADAESRLKGFESDSPSIESVMARVVTNDSWTTEGWIRENWETFAGVKTGTGTWEDPEHYASVSDEMIVINTAVDDEDEDTAWGTVSYLVTNSLPNHTGFEVRSQICFADSYGALPEGPARFGIALTDSAQDECCFAVRTNGVWTTIDLKTYRPVVGYAEEYEVTIRVNKKTKKGSYLVRSKRDATSKCLIEYDLAETSLAEPTKAAFSGSGRLRTLEGDGFDVTLVNLYIDFDEGSMIPGTNFAGTAVSGKINFEQLWLTDHTTGTVYVTIRDKDGNPVGTSYAVDFKDFKEKMFQYYFEGLTPGESYSANAGSDIEGFESDSPSIENTMARVVTNDTWATEGWIRENWATFAGTKLGTGIWKDPDRFARVSDDLIVVDTTTDDGNIWNLVSFFATNALAKHTGFEVRHHLFFDGACDELPKGEWRFGFCVVTAAENDYRFAFITNGVWMVVDPNVYQPILGDTEEYEIATRVNQKTMKGAYFVRSARDATSKCLVEYDLAPFSVNPPTQVSLSGAGRLRQMEGDGYDVTLVNLYIDFDESSMFPGTNFEGTAISGKISFEQLWLTDRTNGTIYVRIYDKNGEPVGTHAVDFHDFNEQMFRAYIEGLEPGESYSANAESDQEGVESDSSSVENVMARVVTNDLWATDGWIREDWQTFAGEKLGTGDWIDPGHFAIATNEMIIINTTPEEGGPPQIVSFVATNALPQHTGYEIRSRLVFDRAYTSVPADTGRFGITILNMENNDYRFAVLTNGAWTSISPSVYQPIVGADEYEVTIRVDLKRMKGTYFVRSTHDAASRFLLEYDLAPSATEPPVQTDFSGVGRVRTHEGDGFDVTLVNVTVDFDNPTIIPGTNFEASIVNGTLHFEQMWLTDRTNGVVKVVIRDKEGRVVAEREVSFQTLSDTIFRYYAEGLVPGESYSSEIETAIKGFENKTTTVEGLMARIVTNDLWATEGWIRENWETFAGLKLGTGDWIDSDGLAVVSNELIAIDTMRGSGLADHVSFLSTNELPQHTGVELRSRLYFDVACLGTPTTTEEFGVTVVEDEPNEYLFAVLTNGVWMTIDRDVCRPVVGGEHPYEVTLRIDEKRMKACYLVRAEQDVHPICLVEYDLARPLAGTACQADFYGTGRLQAYEGDGFDVTLVNIEIELDDSTLYPGTNFEASVVNGTLHFEQFWATDRTNGQVNVFVRDAQGRIVGRGRVTFRGFDDKPFEYVISDLVPGEVYTADVSADIKDAASDQDSAEGQMARVVTNDTWATEGWIREDSETFAGEKLGTGNWIDPEHLAYVTNDLIVINTMEGGEEETVLFSATNALPNHTGFEIKSHLFFDEICSELPSARRRFGITVVDEEVNGAQFAVLTNGVWMLVSPNVYTPILGDEEEYEVVLRVDQKRLLGFYFVRSARDVSPVCIAEYAVAPTLAATPYWTSFAGVGRVRTHVGDGFDVSLVEASLEMDEHSLRPGTNFTETVARGVLHLRPLWATDRTASALTIQIRDAHGQLIHAQTLSYQTLVDQNFDLLVDGLKAGESYDVEVTVDFGGDEVKTESKVLAMGRPLEGWIRENPATFAGEDQGTGLWFETNETAFVVESTEGRAIQISADIVTAEPVRYSPTNETTEIRASTVREVRFDLTFDSAGWYSSGNPPPTPSDAFVGATIWCDDSKEVQTEFDYALAVITTNGTWCVLEDTRALLHTTDRCTVRVTIDSRAGSVRYDLETAGATNRVYQYDFVTRAEDRPLEIGFIGTGRIWSLNGDAWDPNLIRSATDEFADLDEAIRATAGQDEMLSPLWWANQLVTIRRGAFKIDDPDNWLTVRFPWWYYVEVSTNGSVRVYRFNQSNNWIDYAADGPENIEILDEGRLFLVKTPEGLSWVAAMATNAWVSGRIELAGDIDLSKHNWTPIAGFSGAFDGKDRLITGLNNSFRSPGIPGGEYLFGPTNAWGRSTYGLFGTATNAVLSNVRFNEVAISNLADSVAALVGALAGQCTISNVTIESGSLFGSGGTVAGLAGFADFDESLRVVGNTNNAAVCAGTTTYGEGRWGAGLLCVAGPTDPSAPLGTVIVTNNVNYGTISGTLYDFGLLGGNLAQILAGTTVGARFGEVYLTNNLAAGAVDAFLVHSSDDAFTPANFPEVNLAPAFWGYDASGTFVRYLEGNRPGAIAVDPHYRTARMLSSVFPNGTVNEVGLLNDEITASLPGSTVSMNSGLTSWGTINIDRDLTFDLGGYMIYTLYVSNTFTIATGVHATIQNGEIVVGYGEDEATKIQPFAGDLTNLETNNLVVTRVDDTFYERTTLMLNGEPLSALWLNEADLAAILNTSGTVIELYEGAEVEIDVASGTLKVGGCVVAHLNACYGFDMKTTADGGIYFEVRIADAAAPTAEFVMTGVEPGVVQVRVQNAQPGFWYALQRKNSLVAEWVNPAADEWKQADENGVLLKSTMEGGQSYYRVIMTDHPDGAAQD